jgi:hypothetical protein
MSNEGRKITLQEFNEIYETFSKTQKPPSFEHEGVHLARIDEHPHILLRTRMGFEAQRRVFPEDDVELLKQRNEKDHLWSVLSRCGFEMELGCDEEEGETR